MDVDLCGGAPGVSGALPRAAAHLVDALALDNDPTNETSFFFSCVELYLEAVFDLLDEAGPADAAAAETDHSPQEVAAADVCGDCHDSQCSGGCSGLPTRSIGGLTEVEGLTELQVYSTDEVAGLIDAASKRRKQQLTSAATAQSRRSWFH